MRASIASGLGPLDTEILKAEQTRTTLLAVGALLALAASSMVAWLSPEAVGKALGGNFPIVRLQLFFLGALTYELIARAVFSLALKHQRRLPVVGRMVNAFIETSLPGVPILMIGHSLGPIQGLNSPAAYAYAFFILLSILRLDWRVSLFTGIVAAAQYIILADVLLTPETPGAEGKYLSARPLYAIRAGMLFVLGAAAAFVSRQLHLRIVNALQSMQERDQIVSVFGRHVSPSVAARLLLSDGKKEVAGERRNVSVMFLDIRGFTSFSEGRSPEEVFEFLNRVFAFMIDVVHEHGGIINKFLGDGFMAVFGAPIDSRDHNRECFRAARRILTELEARKAAGEFAPFEIGIGIHAGEAMTGNVGSKKRQEYTIIGDVVNLASRLEQLNKTVGSRLLLSGDVYEQLQPEDQAHLQLHGPVDVRGRKEAVRAYRLR